MVKITVDVWVCHKEQLKVMFRNVELDMGDKEHCNKNMERTFEAQHPELIAQIPTWTDKRGFNFRANFECEQIYP